MHQKSDIVIIMQKYHVEIIWKTTLYKYHEFSACITRKAFDPSEFRCKNYRRAITNETITQLKLSAENII